jgi:hypothetical protein
MAKTLQARIPNGSLYAAFKSLCAQEGYTLVEATNNLLRWAVDHQEIPEGVVPGGMINERWGEDG